MNSRVRSRLGREQHSGRRAACCSSSTTASFAVTKARSACGSAPSAAVVWSSFERGSGLGADPRVLFVALCITLPEPLVTSLQLLGSTTSGVPLFVSSIILRALRPSLSISIVASTASRLGRLSRAALR
jgi:hypothetical protein